MFLSKPWTIGRRLSLHRMKKTTHEWQQLSETIGMVLGSSLLFCFDLMAGVAPPSGGGGGGAASAVGSAALHGAQRGAAIAQKGVVSLTIYVQRPMIASFKDLLCFESKHKHTHVQSCAC